MRLRSDIWVSAFLRRCMVEGLYGAVRRKGALEAGTIYVLVSHLDGTCHLFGPAPGPSIDEQGERRWATELPPPASQPDAEALLERKARFDPDIWIVEIEDRQGTAGIVAID